MEITETPQLVRTDNRGTVYVAQMPLPHPTSTRRLIQARLEHVSGHQFVHNSLVSVDQLDNDGLIADMLALIDYLVAEHEPADQGGK